MDIEFCDKEKAVCIKAVLAIIVMLGHIEPAGTPWYVDCIIGTGEFCVGIFFFYSGYGLSINWDKYGKKYLA